MPSGEGPSMPLSAQILILLFLILMFALFSAIETALLSCSRNKIKNIGEENQGKAEKAEFILDKVENPEKYIDTIHGISVLICFLAAAVAAVGIADNFQLFLHEKEIYVSYGLSIFIVILLSSAVAVILGIFYPRRLALQHAEGILFTMIGFMSGCATLFTPFRFIMSGIANILLRITKQRTENLEGEFSEDDVMSMLEAGQESGALKEEGKKMIDSIFKFDDKLAYEIMTPRTDVFLIDVNDPPEEYLEELMEMRYSRIPVYEFDTDNIIGILNIKDYLIKAREKGFEHVDVRSILRKAYFVPETKNIDSLFVNLQSSKNHIAILIDEFGGFSGIVTMEDIIEEVMGDIDDEYDEQETEIEKTGENEYIISGFAYLNDINDELGLKLESDNSETLGGFIIDILGEIPDDNEHPDQEIEVDNLIFRLLSVKERRIEKVQLTILEKSNKESDKDSEKDNKAGHESKENKDGKSGNDNNDGNGIKDSKSGHDNKVSKDGKSGKSGKD